MEIVEADPVTGKETPLVAIETAVDLPSVERYLAEVHPEMLSTLSERVEAARHPPAPPARPPRRRK